MKKAELLNDLLEKRESKFIIQVEIIGSKCCDECLKMDYKIFELEDAITKQPLPNSNCTRKKGCVCCYGFIGKRGENGELIMKKNS